MKNQERISDLYESILHMAVNFGESKNYPEQIVSDVSQIAELTKLSTAFICSVVEAKLTIEVAEHIEEYTQTLEGVTAEEIVKEFVDNFRIAFK